MWLFLIELTQGGMLKMLNELNNYYYEKREFKLFVDINELIDYITNSKYDSVEKKYALKILNVGTEEEIKQEMERLYFSVPCTVDNRREQYGYYVAAYLAQRDLLEENMRYDGICTKCGKVNSIKESYIITPPHTECDICGNRSFVKGECKCEDYIITCECGHVIDVAKDETFIGDGMGCGIYGYKCPICGRELTEYSYS